jgi:hypothetical protein
VNARRRPQFKARDATRLSKPTQKKRNVPRARGFALSALQSVPPSHPQWAPKAWYRGVSRNGIGGIWGWYPGVSGGGILGYPGVSEVSAHHPAHCCPPNDTNYNGTRRAKGYPGWAKQMLYNIRRSATPFRSPKGAPPLVALYACEPQWFGLRRARNIPQVHTLDF